MTTLELKYTINEIILESESIENFNCSICYDLIGDKEIYQCKEGHWNCKKCWEDSLAKKKECMTCRLVVKSIKELSRNRFLEQEYLNKKVYCPNSFNWGSSVNEFDKLNNGYHGDKKSKDLQNGCKEIISIGNLDNHLQSCNFRFVKCDFKGCDHIARMDKLKEHQKDCKFNLVYCKYCEKDVGYQTLLKHYDNVCPKFKIQCSQGCGQEIQRDQMNLHIENDCSDTMIDCVYRISGCKSEKFKRSHLAEHLNTINHSLFMSDLIEKQAMQLQEATYKINQLSKQMELLTSTINKNNQFAERIGQLESQSKRGSLRLDARISKIESSIEKSLFKYKNKWVISNYTAKSQKTMEGQKISSPLIELFDKKFEVSIYPNAYSKDHSGHFSIYLFSKSPEKPLYAKYTITLLNSVDPSKDLTITSEQLFSIKTPGWGRGKLIKSENIKKDIGWLINDALTIEFEIEIGTSLGNKPLITN